MTNIRIMRNHIALRKVCGKRVMRRSLSSVLSESGLNDNQMRSLWQDKGVVAGVCFCSSLDRGVAPEVFVAAVFDMRKACIRLSKN